MIVNPEVRVAVVFRNKPRAICLMRERPWPDGTPVMPANGGAGSALRIRLLRRALGASPVALAEYRRRLHCQEPPLVLGSDRDRVAFVARGPGAIGYVAAGTPSLGVRFAGRPE